MTVEAAGRISILTQTDAAAEEAKWGLLADLHLSWDAEAARAGFFPDTYVAATVDSVLATPLDGVIVNGDLAWMSGLRQDYERVRERLEPLRSRLPLVLAAGNHDRRDHLLREFAPEALAENPPANAVAVIETPVVRIIVLDSLFRVDVTAGLLGRAQRAWLADFLGRRADKPAVLVVHHPLKDDDGALLDAERLLQILRPAATVQAVFTGHDHVFRAERYGRLHVVGLPSAGLPFDREIPPGWVEATFRDRGVELRLHSLSSDAPCVRELLWER